jgi:hypothetical protein
MSNLQSDLDTLQAGVGRLITVVTTIPKLPEKAGQKEIARYTVEQKEHDEAAERIFREEGPKLAAAGFRVLAQFFRDINSIADGVNK